MALPIAGKFLTKVYNNGTLGVHRTDRFERPTELPDYNCDGITQEETEQEGDSGYNSGSDDEFFD
jgi:penicillin-binding protein 1A